MWEKSHFLIYHQLVICKVRHLDIRSEDIKMSTHFHDAFLCMPGNKWDVCVCWNVALKALTGVV